MVDPTPRHATPIARTPSGHIVRPRARTASCRVHRTQEWSTPTSPPHVTSRRLAVSGVPCHGHAYSQCSCRSRFIRLRTALSTVCTPLGCSFRHAYRLLCLCLCLCCLTGTGLPVELLVSCGDRPCLVPSSSFPRALPKRSLPALFPLAAGGHGGRRGVGRGARIWFSSCCRGLLCPGACSWCIRAAP
jgi:hypothetical protein